MRVFTRQCEIAVSAEQAWPVLADVVRWHEWTTSIQRTEPLGQPGLAVGARYRVFQPKLPPAVYMVTACEPPRAFTWISSRAGLRVVGEHVLAPSPGGCTLQLRLEYAGPLGGLVGLMARGLTEDYMEREASGLRRRCEAGG
jgi:Polyketide cyclase / dehydrase and lipid transport